MEKKRSSYELIIDSLLELLETTPIDKITVAQIVDNCGIAHRTFYNNFKDKYDVLSSFYIDRTQPHLNDNLSDWLDFKNELFFKSLAANKNSMGYEGQNSLVDTMVKIEVQKFLMHVDPSIDRSSELMGTIVTGLQYMCFGQLGLMKMFWRGDSYFAQNLAASLTSGDEKNFLLQFIPEVVHKNLVEEPIRKGAYWNNKTGRIEFSEEDG